mgnify:CR=1 FL=1
MAVMEVLTGASVIITTVFAYLTWRMVSISQATFSEVQDQTWNAHRPRVLVEPYARPHTNIFYLRIRNVGSSTASDLTLKIDKEFWKFGEKRDNNGLHLQYAFQKPLVAFHPGQDLRFALAQGFKIFGVQSDPALCPAEFTVSTSYSYLGRLIEEEFLINLNIYLGSEGEKLPIVKALEQLSGEIKNKKFT